MAFRYFQLRRGFLKYVRATLDVPFLLEPLSPDSPCGEDLEYDPDFGQMERAAQGKPEQQFGDTIVPPEAPDWKEVKSKALGLLERTKDMRVVVRLACVALAMDGVSEFRDAMAVLHGYVEQYWESVFPQLDADDNNDPTYRMNTLSSLCDPSTLQLLRDTPLVSSRVVGKFSLRDVEWATAHAKQSVQEEPEQGAWSDEGTVSEPAGPKSEVIQAAFTDVDVESIQETSDAVRQSMDHVNTLDQLVTDHVGAAFAVSMTPLVDTLTSMDRILTQQLERRGVRIEAEAEGGDDETAGAGTAVAAGTPLTGDISCREDVLRALDKVCQYYERHEPSSPLPLLIRRAQRLATKSFLEIIRDLAPDALNQAKALGGAGGGGNGDGYEEASGAAESESEEASSKW